MEGGSTKIFIFSGRDFERIRKVTVLGPSEEFLRTLMYVCSSVSGQQSQHKKIPLIPILRVPQPKRMSYLPVLAPFSIK